MYIKCSDLNIKNNENIGILNKQYINLDTLNSKINKLSICFHVIINIIFILCFLNKPIRKILPFNPNQKVGFHHILVAYIVGSWVFNMLSDVLDENFFLILIICIAMFFTLYFIIRSSMSSDFLPRNLFLNIPVSLLRLLYGQLGFCYAL